MGIPIRKDFFHPALALGSTLLWGILEFIALQRSHRRARQSHSLMPRNR